VRVRTQRLDELLDLVGELVIAHAMLAQDPRLRTVEHPELARKLGQTDRIVRALQNIGMSLRMVPLKSTFQKLERVVRDTARQEGRLVDFVVEGEGTEIDRHMVDAIADPLIHLVRNAVHHGIEPPSVREARGKPPAGRIELSACHAGGRVVIRVRDDGGGLDRQRIVEQARSRGWLRPGGEATEAEVLDWIFAPGLSTASEVGETSGRGVGLDVVRRSVAELRGRIDVQSDEGRGPSFVLALPLTLAVTEGMLARVGRERLVLPSISIQTALRGDAAQIVHYQGREEMIRLRDSALPIVRLHRVFGIGNAQTDPARALFIVVADGERRAALMVDELLGQQQVVAKALPRGLLSGNAVAGATILGDGRVGLILDPALLLGLRSHGDALRAAVDRAA
jgi:two-component system chemotaxis sensor kinase CheA